MKFRHLLLVLTMIGIGFSAKAQTTGEKIKEFADKHLKLSGYIQGGFEWNEDDVLPPSCSCEPLGRRS